MPLNYSKWDALELSDDSDIEGHPNVDHKSLVRWKQRQIHEEREARKSKIAHLKAELETNPVLETRLREIRDGVKDKGSAFFSSTVERLEKQPSPEKPPAPLQGTYDSLILSLLRKMVADINQNGIKDGDPKLEAELLKALNTHLDRMPEYQKTTAAELDKEEAEQKKKITSDDIRPGFDSAYIPPKPEPLPLAGNRSATQSTSKQTTYEVLNPKGVASSSSTPPAEEEELSVPEMTPSIEGFSKLPLRGFSESWEYIKQHRDVVVPGASDSLLIAAFRAQQAGNNKYAKQCTHQSLLLQYGEKLGNDGMSIFFRKMIHADPRAMVVFCKDVDDTYAHICERVRIAEAEAAAAGQKTGEQIQLVPENPDAVITFNVPDGPPPEHITLEGPGTENMDIEGVRKALQMQWEVFESFDDSLKEALRSQSLENVNKVLGAMEVPDAEQVVKSLEMSGILNFADGDIRDETGQPDDDEEEYYDDEEEDA